MKKEKVIVIGAGIGGLTAAIYLSKEGYEVTVLEKNSFPGGRCANLVHEGHRFDIGATLLMMPDVYERTFRDWGKNIYDDLDLIRMDPVYRIKFHDSKELLFSSDLMKMKHQLESIEPGSYSRFLEYMDESYRSYMISMKHIIDRNYYHAFQFINLRNVFLLKKLRAFEDHYKRASKFFRSEHLRTAFSFQNIYVGQNPLNASAIFSMLPFMELTDGVWFPTGGMNRIVDSMVKIANDYGVKIRYQSPVQRIVIKDKKATGVILKDESFVPSSILVSNADLPYVYEEMLPRKNGKMSRLKYTCSAFVFHWGTDTVFPGLEQHNVFVSGNYKDSITQVFRNEPLTEEPSFYVHSPAQSDATAAPEGQDSLSVIVPVSNLGGNHGIDWEKDRISVRQHVFDRLEREGIKDLGSHIKFEKCYTPKTWKSVFNLSKGATFGSLNHNIFQMGYFRPHNQHPVYKNLFFAGGSTHPGNGVPLAMISGRLASEKILHLQ